MLRSRTICLVLAIGLYLFPGLSRNAVAQSDDGGERKTLLYVARHLSAADLANALGNVLDSIDPDAGSVVAEPVTNHVFVTANPATLEKVTKILAQVDRPPKMVSIEVQIVQVTRQVDSKGKGSGGPFDWGSSGATEDKLARLRELEQKGQLEFRDQIKLTTLDNQPAFVQVGQQKPVVTSVQYAQGSSSSGSRTFSRPPVRNSRDVRVGTMVEVTPRVTPDGMVVMELKVEKSWLAPASAGGTAEKGEGGPSFSATKTETCTAQTTCSLTSGQTAVVGGMHTTVGSTQTQLLILVTANVLK